MYSYRPKKLEGFISLYMNCNADLKGREEVLLKIKMSPILLLILMALCKHDV